MERYGSSGDRHMFLAYETLRIVLWLVLGVAVVGFAIVNGFGLGVAILLPFVAWFLLVGVAIFAPWPRFTPSPSRAFSSPCSRC
jgi:cytochrome bd-type quinol oxidase subunit 2